jgi:enoyl-CoA hydratase/carnithine racemase
VDYQGIVCRLDHGVLMVTINRPERLNAIDTLTMNELTNAFSRADTDDDVRVVIVTGEGRAFCAGGDLSTGAKTFDAVAMDRATSVEDNVETGGPMAMGVFRNRKPFIAAINGPAVGIGLTMTLPMDVRLATPDAKLSMTFVRRGIVPDACATWFLPRLVGLSRALDWTCSGRTFTGKEAYEAGLVQSLHSSDEIVAAAEEIAREIVRWTPPVAVAVARQLILRMSGAAHPMDAYDVDSKAIFEMGRSHDAAEGVMAFLEKRPPVFTGKVTTDMPSVYPWWTRWEALNDGVGGDAAPFTSPDNRMGE